MLNHETKLTADQANKLVYSSYEMTLNEKRLLTLAICMLSSDLTAFPIAKIKTAELSNYLDLRGRSLHFNLKETCRKLLKRIVEVDDTKGNWSAHQWVSRCKITHGGELEIRLHDDLMPYLLKLNKHYQSIRFEYLSKIKKSHAIRIFEILWHKRHESGIPKNKIEIAIDELRKMLLLQDKYPVFGHFKLRVLEPAKKEIASSTPLGFTYKVKRVGQKVKSVEFTVFENDDYKAQKLPKLNTEMLLELKEENDNNERKRIIWKHVCKHMNHGSLEVEYKKLTEKGKTLEEIEEAAKWAAEEIDRRSKTNDPINNPPAFVRWAMRGGKEDRDNMRRRKKLTR